MPRTRPRADRALVVLFSGTIFIGAGLLFVVQPLVARLLLPSYGGSPTVWSTSSLFFQVLLLAAYLYVHATTGRLGRRQPLLHLFLLAVPLLALPIVLPDDAAPTEDASPTLWLLRTLVLLIGVPFVVVATTGPLMQKWFSWTDHVHAADPYFLFAASNLGSFGGLLAYPFLIEPTMTLDQQRLWWSIGFGIFVALVGACGALTWRRSKNALPAPADHQVSGARVRSTRLLGRRRVGVWLLLAFLPSSLMLAVTAHLSTDVAVIPLLWVVPLAIYLATFVIAFSRRSRTPPVWAARAAGSLVVAASAVAIASADVPIALSMTINLGLLGLAGYAAHGRLAADRPPAEHLTFFYVIVSVGGAAGGLLNGLLAPVVFDRILEYPLALVAVALLGAGITIAPLSRVDRRYHPAFTFVLRVSAVFVGILAGFVVLAKAGASSHLSVVAMVAFLSFLGWRLGRRPVVLATSMGLVLITVGALNTSDSIERDRTFFGSFRVDAKGSMHTLVHGTTVHGTQWQDERRDVPTTYYARSGPLGDVFALDRGRRFGHVGAVGLGTGTVAAYGRSGQEMTFFEIDPGMVRMASDTSLFTYLAQSAADVRTVVGDGRLKVEDLPAGELDLLILDAFSSDSIPIHLLTVEAMQMYADRMAPDGLIAVHVSNRVFDLEPVVAAAGEELGWRGAIGHGRSTKDGATPSSWIVLGKAGADVDELLDEPGWRQLDISDTVRWTDDYSSLLAVIR